MGKIQKTKPFLETQSFQTHVVWVKNSKYWLVYPKKAGGWSLRPRKGVILSLGHYFQMDCITRITIHVKSVMHYDPIFFWDFLNISGCPNFFFGAWHWILTEKSQNPPSGVWFVTFCHFLSYLSRYRRTKMNTPPNLTFFSNLSKTWFLRNFIQNHVSWGSGVMKEHSVPTLSHFYGLQLSKSQNRPSNLRVLEGFGAHPSENWSKVEQKWTPTGDFAIVRVVGFFVLRYW